MYTTPSILTSQSNGKHTSSIEITENGKAIANVKIESNNQDIASHIEKAVRLSINKLNKQLK